MVALGLGRAGPNRDRFYRVQGLGPGTQTFDQQDPEVLEIHHPPQNLKRIVVLAEVLKVTLIRRWP